MSESPTSLRLPKEMLDRVKAEAKKAGVTVSAFVAKAVEERIAQQCPDCGRDTGIPREPVGPISPRLARDDIEGEAIAPSDHENHDYCPVSWKGNDKLICTRPVHKEGDHVVGKEGGLVIARWPMDVEEKSKPPLPKKARDAIHTIEKLTDDDDGGPIRKGRKS